MKISRRGIRGRVYNFIRNDAFPSKMMLRPFPYNIFRALCGNKFTRNLLSLTMIVSIQCLSSDEAGFINSLCDGREIAASLIFLGLKYGGKLKPMRREQRGSDSYESFDKSLELFVRYVDTGLIPMSVCIMVDAPRLTRKIISDMREGCEVFNNEELQIWSNYTTVEHAINNARKVWKTHRKIVTHKCRTRVINA